MGILSLGCVIGPKSYHFQKLLNYFTCLLRSLGLQYVFLSGLGSGFCSGELSRTDTNWVSGRQKLVAMEEEAWKLAQEVREKIWKNLFQVHMRQSSGRLTDITGERMYLTRDVQRGDIISCTC